MTFYKTIFNLVINYLCKEYGNKPNVTLTFRIIETLPVYFDTCNSILKSSSSAHHGLCVCIPRNIKLYLSARKAEAGESRIRD